jgi:hypothetical protein
LFHCVYAPSDIDYFHIGWQKKIIFTQLVINVPNVLIHKMAICFSLPTTIAWAMSGHTPPWHKILWVTPFLMKINIVLPI